MKFFVDDLPDCPEECMFSRRKDVQGHINRTVTICALGGDVCNLRKSQEKGTSDCHGFKVINPGIYYIR